MKIITSVYNSVKFPDFFVICFILLVSCSQDIIPHIAYYENGNKMEEGTFKSSEKHGIWINWYEDGTKKSEGRYKKGMMDGDWIFFHENGSVKANVIYIEGSGEGTMDDIPSEGLEGECIFFLDNGTKKSEHFYKK